MVLLMLAMVLLVLARWSSFSAGTCIKVDVERRIYELSIPSPPYSLHLLGLWNGIEVGEVLLPTIAARPLVLPISLHCLHILLKYDLI